MRYFSILYCDLRREHKVDLAFWAHEHSYERCWPVYNNTVYNGTTHPGHPYRNAGATVHIVAGAAGCREQHDRYKGPRGAWSAVRNELYGYGKLRLANRTHMHWVQLEVLYYTTLCYTTLFYAMLYAATQYCAIIS